MIDLDSLKFIESEFALMTAARCGRTQQTTSDEFNRLRRRAIRMEAALLRVARLNPDAGEIGAGMLRTIVSEARNALS
jgi:hypothetical protein